MSADEILLGDAAETLSSRVEDDSVDLLVTDPPYGYGFMGKDWDKAVPPVSIWKECVRVLKFGAFAFILCTPRQDCLSHMIVNLGEAGFDTGFSSIYWAYASGFPKAMNVSKAVDKKLATLKEPNPQFQEVRRWLRGLVKAKGLGYLEIDTALGNPNSHKASHYLDNSQPQIPTVEDWEILKKLLGVDADLIRAERNTAIQLWEREIIGQREKEESWTHKGNRVFQTGNDTTKILDITIPKSDQAKLLDGSYGGFQPKPAVEVIIVAMKPLSERTYVDQALKNGKGMTWLDDARIPFQSDADAEEAHDNALGPVERFKTHKMIYDGGKKSAGFKDTFRSTGRFPANLLVSDDILNDGQERRSGDRNGVYSAKGNLYGQYGDKTQTLIGDVGSFSRYFDLDKWWSEKMTGLPESVRRTFPFLIVAKASKTERNQGLERAEIKPKTANPNFGSGGFSPPTGQPDREIQPAKNFHPTVKPLKLMSYLITLGSRKGDLVCDPFIGSGTTALAARILERHYLGIELNPEYVQIAKARLAGTPFLEF